MSELKKERDTANAELKAKWENAPRAEAAVINKEGDALLAKMLNTPKAKD